MPDESSDVPAPAGEAVVAAAQGDGVQHGVAVRVDDTGPAAERGDRVVGRGVVHLREPSDDPAVELLRERVAPVVRPQAGLEVRAVAPQVAREQRAHGSTDGTAQLARALGLPRVRVVEYSPNRGKGYALVAGFRESVHPLVAFFDGDLDLDPSVLPGYLDRLDTGEVDVVVGSKVHPDSRVDYPPTRRVASRAFRLATRLVLGLDLGDTQTGAKAMRRSVAASAVEGCRLSGFAFDLELMCRLVDDGARVCEAPVVLDYAFSTSIGAGSALEAFSDLRRVARSRRDRAALSASTAGVA